MPRPCEVCSHRANRDIDRQIQNGGRLAQLSRRYGFSSSSLQRHRQNHLALSASPARPSVDVSDRGEFEMWLEQAKLESAADVLNFSRWLLWRVEKIVSAAETDGDVRTALAGLASMQKTLTELFAKTTGAISDGPRIDASTRVVAILGNLTEDDLRGLAALGRAAESLPG